MGRFFFNIRDILEFEINLPKRYLYKKRINLEFSFFESQKINHPDIIVNVGNFRPSNDHCYVVDHQYHIKENYFYCKDSEKRNKWEVEIFGFEEGPTIVNMNFKHVGVLRLLPFFTLENLFLKPLIAYKLSLKHYLLLHASAVSKENKGYIFAGRDGAFKSTLAMDFIREAKFDFLGDEMVILDGTTVLSYPVQFKPFIFRCRYLPTEDTNHIFDKVRLGFFLLRQQSNYANMDQPIHVVSSSKISALFLVVKKINSELVIRPCVNPRSAVMRLVANDEIEIGTTHMSNVMRLPTTHFYRYMLAYSYVFPQSKVATHWCQLKETVMDVLAKVPIFEIEMPEHYTKKAFRELLNFVTSRID